MAKKKTKGSSESKGPELNGKPLSKSVDELIEYLEVGGDGGELIYDLFKDLEKRLEITVHPKLKKLQEYDKRINVVLAYLAQYQEVRRLKITYEGILDRYKVDKKRLKKGKEDEPTGGLTGKRLEEFPGRVYPCPRGLQRTLQVRCFW
jgi:hypothetical protein